MPEHNYEGYRDYSYLDDYTAEQIADIKEETRLQRSSAIATESSPEKYIIAEGDSWFDYLPGMDLIDCLQKYHGYKIECFAKAGDTLENMTYGTRINRDYSRDIPQFYRVIKRVGEKKPKFFLFSGGGNDIAGDEFISFLNHKLSSPANVFRLDYANEMINTVFKGCFKYLLDEVSHVSENTMVISHGYGHTNPTGIGVSLLGFDFAGPWLRPALVKKAILNVNEQRAIVRQIIDMYNEMLLNLSDSYSNFIYVDLRDVIDPNYDWVNELHLKNSAYARCAEKIHKRISLVP